ncbi:MAG TPA: helix-turn-helix domain-containing protein [Pararhizobium sp.]|nr:helix-turn-helix domain-containing protein [Pararhizobium sp.]
MSEVQAANATVFNERSDPDTLGGRISRARDALNLTTSQLARRLGVKSETVHAWETDRSEPRANRLTMLAGMMGVSPTWLLNGVGDAPHDGRMDSELQLLHTRLSKLKEIQGEAGRLISSLESELMRVSGALQK